MKLPRQLNPDIALDYFKSLRRPCAHFSIDEPQKTVEALITAALQSEIIRLTGRQGLLSVCQQRVIMRLAEWLRTPAGPAGVMMLGTCGNGKTTMMRALLKLIEEVDYQARLEAHGGHPMECAVLSASEITVRCRDAKSYAQAVQRFKDYDLLCIDDLGEEETESVSFGTRVRPVVDILMHRYDRRKMTIVTSNLSPKEISPRYGDRLADRFQEYMLPVIFDGPSLRRQCGATGA